MGMEAQETAQADATPAWPIEVRPNGTVMFDGIAIGGLDLLDGGTSEAGVDNKPPRLTLNLGWMRLAGLHIRVQGDPDVDRNRTGIVLER